MDFKGEILESFGTVGLEILMSADAPKALTAKFISILDTKDCKDFDELYNKNKEAFDEFLRENSDEIQKLVISNQSLFK